MNTRTVITATAGGILALAGIGGTVGGFATGRATAPTPEACIQALSDADQIITLKSDALGVASDALVYAYEWDTDGLEQATGDLDAINADMDAIDYVGPSAECRSGR